MSSPRRFSALLGCAAALLGCCAVSASAAEPEQPLAKPASAVTATSAILHGELNPHSKGAVSEYQFEYLQSSEACSPAQEILPQPPAPAAGAEKEAVQVEAEDLEPGATYSFCVIANPNQEPAQSTPLSFTTLPGPTKPLVLKGTTTASAVTASSATLNANINPEKQKTHYSFTYATNEALTENVKTLPGGRELEAEFSTDEVSAPTGNALAPASTYYFRVNATNPSGTTQGPVQRFTTQIEAPNTREATSVTGTSAILHGELNPGASATAGYQFVYRPGAGSCEGEGATTTEPGAPQTGKGVYVSQLVEGLEGSTEYTFCVQATTPGPETKTGEAVTFTTAAEKPIIASESASASTPFSATLEASVNPENQPTSSCVFEYGTITAGEHQQPCEPASLEGTTARTITTALKRLKPASKYRYRVVVGNPTGTTAGAEQELETPAAQKPTVNSQEAERVTPFAATLHTRINTESQDTECSFEYATSEAALLEHKGTNVLCNPFQLPPAEEAQSGRATLTGLQPNTPYYYRVSATNAAGTTESVIETFTTQELKPPIVETNTVAVTAFEATVAATVYTEFQETTCVFEYANNQSTLTEGKGAKLACDLVVHPGSGGEHAEAVTTLTGLSPGSAYYYRVVARNATGTTVGAARQLETAALAAPTIESLSAPDVSAVSATVAAQVNPGYQGTSCVFEYAAVEATVLEGKGSSAPCTPTNLGIGGEPVGVSASLTGLTPGQSYSYRLLATNALGSVGSLTVKHFKTLGAPAVSTGATSALTATTAGLAGTVDPEGAPTSYHFAYIDQAGYEAAGGEASGIDPARNPYALGYSTPEVNVGSDAASHPAAASLVELAPASTYHYALVATSEAGTTVVGHDMTFTTPPGPPAAGETPAISPPPLGPAFTPSAAPPFVPFQTISQLTAQEAKEHPKPISTPRPTRAQKLATALRACRRRPKAQRAKCERQAHRKYGQVKGGKKTN